jgi:hypothetical protein
MELKNIALPRADPEMRDAIEFSLPYSQLLPPRHAAADVIQHSS